MWDNAKGLLKWEPNLFGPMNTILLDDSPYKGLKNPVREVSNEVNATTYINSLVQRGQRSMSQLRLKVHNFD